MTYLPRVLALWTAVAIHAALAGACAAPAAPEPAQAAAPATPAAPPESVVPDAPRPAPPVVPRARPPGREALDDGDEQPPKVPAGLVPAELADDLIEIEHPFPSPLAEPDGCLAKQSDQDCFWDVPTIVGFSRERGEVAFLYVPFVPADDEAPQELIGERVRLRDGKSQERKQFGPIVPEGGVEPARNAKLRDGVRAWIDGLQRGGFAAGRDLKAWGGAVRARGAIAFPLAVLGAPMTGWMLYAPSPAGDTLTLKLIAPDNEQEFVIGTTPVKTGQQCLDPPGATRGKCKQRVRFTDVTFGSVELDPARTHLVALFSASFMSQDEEGQNDWRVFALPPAVQAALPKP